MLNEIIKGIALKLNEVFGDEYTVYQNDIRQGLTEPCFFVQILKPELSPLLGRRSMKRNPFCLTYFPRVPSDNAELYEVGEVLMDAMELIKLPNGDLLRGTQMSYEVNDDTLSFFVSFNHTQIKLQEGNPMETLNVDTALQKG